jgi:hypothetical protein
MSPATPRASSARRAPAKPRLPKERTHFKELLLANHFGTVPGSKLKAQAAPAGNTTYEQLMCVGYQPNLKRLDAVVHIKQTGGYSGDICTAGSQEYVKFFVSTDNGATWSELGTVSFTVWDVPGPKPLEYDATLYVNLAEECCHEENLVLIRAILSWEVPPGGPTDPVVWGNALDETIQVEPIGTMGGAKLVDLIECLPIEISLEQVAEVADLAQPIALGSTKALTPFELLESYAGTKVEPHRFLYPAFQEVLAKPEQLPALLAEPDFQLFPGIANIDISKLIGIIVDPQGNETYEQIGCVGLNPKTSELAATIDVKLSSGYSGGLCTVGSYEYVGFWVDWEDGGGWHYAGTSAVNVHDISAIPKGGLGYSVSLPFAQLLSHRQPCEDGPRTARIRAVLSWATPPSTTDPYAVPFWGGHSETLILIPPGEAIKGGGPELDTIGSMDIVEIDNGTGLATGPAVAVGFTANESPFGGQVWFTGHVVDRAGTQFGGPGIYYRIWIFSEGSWSFMSTTFNVWTTTFGSPPVSHLQTPQNLGPPFGDGWYKYLEDDSTLTTVAQNTLGYWQSAGDGQAWIYMETKDTIGDLGTPTALKLIQLDNTYPTDAISITSGGGSCGDFKIGDTITGDYSASDNEALAGVSFSLEPFPKAISHVVTSPPSPTFQAGTWTLDTSGLDPCGYVVRLDASDRTIVNSGYVGFDWPAFTGFCLKK